jgi:hypothetical protein
MRCVQSPRELFGGVGRDSTFITLFPLVIATEFLNLHNACLPRWQN